MDGIANLYEALSTQFDLGTLNEFRTKIANEQHRRNLYDAVSEQFDLGVADYAGFSAKIDGYLRQPRSVVPDFLTNGQHTQGRTFAEWQMAHAAQQAMREHGTVSDAEARRAFQQVHERGERETHELRYKNGPDGKPKDSYIEDLGAGLMAGLGGVAQLPYKAVGAFEDWGSGIMNKATFGLIQPTNGNGIGRRFVNEVLGGNYFRERTEHYRKESDRYQDGRGIVDAAIDGDWSGALGRLGISTVQNAPNLAISIYLSAMGAPELAAETLGAGAAFDKWEEIQHDDSLSDDDKGVAVLGTFLAEYVFEKIGDVRYQKMFQQGSTAQVRREVVHSARSAWDRMMNSKFAHGLGTVWNKVMKFGGESITEMATDISEQAIDVYLGKQDSIDWRQVGDAGIVALASDGPLQGVHWAVDTHQRRKLTAEIISNPELTAAAQAQGVAPDQMADLLVRAGHGEEMEEADFNALQNYLSAVQEITAQNAEQTAEEQTAEEPEQTETTPANEEQTEETGTIEGKQETARAATILLDGAETPIAFSGAKVVYNEDGSIDREHSSKIFLQDSNGNLILGDQHEAMLEALDNALRQEKKNGDALMRQDVPVTEEPVAEAAVEETRTPEQIAADEAAAQEQAEETRIQEMSAGLEQQLQEKGDKVMDSWNAEEQFVYTMTHSSMEDALADAREALETAKADKNPTRRRKRMQDIQAVIDHYAPQQQEESTVQPLNGTADGQIRPIGIGDFGPIYDQFRGKPQEAIAFLLEKQDGECLGALSHSDIGPIDLVWGYEGTGDSDGFGLAKLVKFHPEVLDNLQGILDEMHVTLRSENRIQLESERYKAGVRLTWNNESKTWLLTAFEKVEHEENNAPGKTTDTAETAKSGEGNDTPLPQSIVSGDKGTTKNPDTQISGEENAEKVDLSAENVVLMYNGNRSNYVFCRKGEDGTLVRLDTGKPLELTRNGKDTAWQDAGRKIVFIDSVPYYMLGSNPNSKTVNVVPVEAAMPVMTNMQGNHSSVVQIEKSVLTDEDGKHVFRNAEDNREEQYKTLRRDAKTLDDIADYVVFDYMRDGVKVEITLRELLTMFSTLNNRNRRIYVGNKKYTGLIDKLLINMGKDIDERARVEDILDQRVKEAAIVWNKFAPEGREVTETKPLSKKISEFIEVLDGRGFAEKKDYFAERIQSEANPNLNVRKRIAEDEDLDALSNMQWELSDARRKGDYKAVAELEQKIAEWHENFTDPYELNAEYHAESVHVGINEEQGRRVIALLRDKGVDVEEISEEEAGVIYGEERAEQLRNNGGALYGIAKDGKIYVISSRLNPNTPVHEFTHLWAREFMKREPKKWANFVKTLKQTEQWQQLIDDGYYASIEDNENAMASEVLARLSGEYWGQIGEDGKSKMEETFEKKSLLTRVRALLRSFWNSIARWNDKGVDLRHKDADSELQALIRMPIEELMSAEGENLHISKKSSTFAPEMYNELALDRYESRVIGNGETVAERRQATDSGLLDDALSQITRRDGDVRETAEQGVRHEGNVERRNAEDAAALEQFAKERGQWVEDIATEFPERYGEIIGHGSESFVYRKDDETVIKTRTIDPNAGGYATIQEALESIAIHNALFPETAMKVVGFGMDDGELNILFEQPYIDGRVATPEEVQQFVSDNFGAVKDESVEGGQSYKTAAYLLQDLKPKNVIVKNIDGKDRLFVIDGDFYYTPEHRRFLSETDVTGTDYQNIEYHIESAENNNADETDVDNEMGAPEVSGDIKTTYINRGNFIESIRRDIHATLADVDGLNLGASMMTAAAERVRKCADRTHPILMLQKSIEAFTGKKLDFRYNIRSRIESKRNAYGSFVERFSKKEKKELSNQMRSICDFIKESTDLLSRFGSDLLNFEEVEKAREDGTPIVEQRWELDAWTLVERYLIACESIERKELLRETRGEETFKGYMGVSIEEYKELFEDAVGDARTKKLWDAIRQCTDIALEYALRYGEIDAASYDTYKLRHYYIPEMNFASDRQRSEFERRANQWHTRQHSIAFAHQAKGGKSLADNIIAQVVYNTQDVVSRAMDNDVRMWMARLLEENKEWCEVNGFQQPQRIWYIRQEDGTYKRTTEMPPEEVLALQEEYNAMARDIDHEIREQQAKRKSNALRLQELRKKLRQSAKNATEERLHIREKIETIKEDNQKIAELLEHFKGILVQCQKQMPIGRSGIVRNAERDYAMNTQDRMNSTVTYFKDGDAYEMFFGGIEPVALCLNNVFNNEGTLDIVRDIASHRAALLTTYNMSFAPVNVIRDSRAARKKGIAEIGFLFPVRYYHNLGSVKTMRALGEYLRTREFDISTEEGRQLKIFIEGGGQTGYSNYLELQEIRQQMQGKNDWINVVEDKVLGLGGAARYLTEFSELWTRFSIFRSTMDMFADDVKSGKITEEDAIRKGIENAMNLSINMSRRGAGDKAINALNSISLFSNPAIQGASSWIRTIEGLTKDKKMWRVLWAMGGSQVLLGFLSAWFNPDDPDDGYIVSDYDREHLLVFGNNRWYPNEWERPFMLIGVNTALMMRGQRDLKQANMSVMKSIVENLLPLPPTITKTGTTLLDIINGNKSGKEMLSDFLTPDAIEDIQKLSEGKSSFGTDLDYYDWGVMPQYKLDDSRGNQISKDFSYWLYCLSGGPKDGHTKYKTVEGNDEEKIMTGMETYTDVSPRALRAWANVFLPQSLQGTASCLYGLGKAVFTDEKVEDMVSWQDVPLLGRFRRADTSEQAIKRDYWELNNIIKSIENAGGFKYSVKNSSYNKRDLKKQITSQVERGGEAGDVATDVEALFNSLPNGASTYQEAKEALYLYQQTDRYLQARYSLHSKKEYEDILPKDSKEAKMKQAVYEQSIVRIRQLLNEINDYRKEQGLDNK